MFRDVIGREYHLVTCGEVFDRVLARIAFRFADGDDEGDFHLVSLANLVADFFLREIDRHGDILATKILRQLICVAHGAFVDDADHEFGGRHL